MTTEDKKQPCGLSELEYNQLKAKHGDLHLVTLKSNKTGETYQSLHKTPDMDAMDMFLSKVGKNSYSAFIALFNTTKVAADKVFESETAVGQKWCNKAGQKLNEVLDDLEGDIKNL
jgi:hypothetical protein